MSDYFKVIQNGRPIGSFDNKEDAESYAEARRAVSGVDCITVEPQNCMFRWQVTVGETRIQEFLWENVEEILNCVGFKDVIHGTKTRVDVAFIPF